MELTPLEIRQVSFKKGFRGYSSLEVDAFVESLADDLEELLRKMADYKERLEKQSKTINELERTEGALTETLLMAQKAMETAKANAQEEGRLIIRQAEVRAEEITAEAVRRESQLQGEIMNLKRAKGYLTEKIRTLIQSVERDLEWEEKDRQPIAPEVSNNMK